MNENALTQELVRRLRRALPWAVVFKHNDMRTAGVPDVSVTGRGRTVWLEAKRGDEVEGKQAQLVTMLRLHSQGRAYYVRYGRAETVVVDPVSVRRREIDGVRSTVRRSPRRHDHEMVVAFVQSLLR